MRRRGATTTHRGSLPSAFPASSSAQDVFSTAGKSRSNRPADVVLDRRLLQKYDEVNSEIARLTRLARMEQNPIASAAALPPSALAPSTSSSANETQQLLQVTADLRKARRSSSQAIQSQKELIDKLERQEKSGLRRFFSLNKESKVERIKSKLSDKLSESVQVDEELQRLERRSDALARTSLASSFNHAALNGSYSHHHASYSALSGLQSVAEVEDELASLEREKDDILNNLFGAIKSPDVQELHARIAVYSSEIHACQSIRKQVDRCATLYRQALQLLTTALAAVVSPHYTGTVREFTQGPYPLAVEASHLIEAAAHGIQPEARRRYDAFAPELVGLQLPKFPQAVADYARRARTNVDPNSALSLEAMRKLRAAESTLMVLQRLVIDKSAVVDAWKKRVEQDQEQAERGHEALEKRLHEQVAVLARSVSV
jgi:Mg2+ and Co2+ transporter CorA